MNEWCLIQHKKSGLVNRVLKSKINENIAEINTIKFLKKYVKDKKSPMAGNTVYQDRLFLKKHMPLLEDFFHYRNLDVSVIKEIISRWNPRILKNFKKKKSKHLALHDIRDSIKELKFYKKNFFILNR